MRVLNQRTSGRSSRAEQPRWEGIEGNPPKATHVGKHIGFRLHVWLLKDGLKLIFFYKIIYPDPKQFEVLFMRGKQKLFAGLFYCEGFLFLYRFQAVKWEGGGRMEYHKENEAEAESSDSMRFSHYSYAVTNVAISFSCSDLLCCHYSPFLCWCIKPLLHICWHLIYLRETSDYPLPRRLIRSVQAKTAELLLEDNKYFIFD